MHDVTRRTGRVFARLVFFCLLALALLGTSASASSSGAEEAEIRSAALSFLRNYQEETLLYEDRDLRANTVADPGLVLPEGTENAVFQISKKDVTLAQLRENIAYLEKKAAYYAGMRQLQGICRENLRLTYSLDTLTIEADTCLASVTATAEFRYTDSSLPSVYETGFSVRLVKLEGRWLVADLTDGSQFDKTYKNSGTLDVDAALAEFAAQLASENCTAAFTGGPPLSGNWIAYNGADAAAYAYTYSRLAIGEERSDFYNTQFYSYAGQGGDCQNFASQCMWAGFGGSQDSASIKNLALPMDTTGSDQWFGRAASAKSFNYSWISCQSFRLYLTGSLDASGYGGSNAAVDAGMYATVLDAGEGSALSAVTAEELIGATAHVYSSGGAYSHAIVLTAATGTSRSQIWVCGHTRDVTNVKLGDFYTGPVKVYIPRYLRTGGSSGILRAERLQPVAVGEAGILTASANGIQQRITITVTPPDGMAEQVVSVDNADNCWTEYLFTVPGLYRVDCSAPAGDMTYYIRCYVPEEPASDAADITPSGAEEDWTNEQPVEEPEQSIEPEQPPVDEEIPGWLLTRYE